MRGVITRDLAAVENDRWRDISLVRGYGQTQKDERSVKRKSPESPKWRFALMTFVLLCGCQTERDTFEVLCNIEKHCPQISSEDPTTQRKGWRCMYEKASAAEPGGTQSRSVLAAMEKMTPKNRHDFLKHEASKLGMKECPGAVVIGANYDNADFVKELCENSKCATGTAAELFQCVKQKFPKAGPNLPESTKEQIYRDEIVELVKRQRREAKLIGKGELETCANVLHWEPEPTFSPKLLASQEPNIDVKYTCDGKGTIPGPFLGNMPWGVHRAVAITSDETSPERVHYLDANNRYSGPNPQDRLVSKYLPLCPAKGETNSYTLTVVLYHGEEVPKPDSWANLRKQIDGRVVKTYERKLSYTRPK